MTTELVVLETINLRESSGPRRQANAIYENMVAQSSVFSMEPVGMAKLRC